MGQDLTVSDRKIVSDNELMIFSPFCLLTLFRVPKLINLVSVVNLNIRILLLNHWLVRQGGVN